MLLNTDIDIFARKETVTIMAIKQCLLALI